MVWKTNRETAIKLFEGRKELFGANWDLVGSAMSVLKRYGIYYIDASPNNINCHNHPLAAKPD